MDLVLMLSAGMLFVEFLDWWATDEQGIVDGLSMQGLKLAATKQSQEGPRCHMQLLHQCHTLDLDTVTVLCIIMTGDVIY